MPSVLPTFRSILPAAALMAGVPAVCGEGQGGAEGLSELQSKIEHLEKENATLRTANERLEKQNTTLRATNIQEKKKAAETAEMFAEVRRRLEALGAAAGSGNEQRLVEAVAEVEMLSGRLRKMEDAAVRLSGTIIAYMQQAVVEDPQSRANVESRLRELDMELGNRQQPLREGAGTLANASIISIDSESGLLVLNVGSTAGLRVGTPLMISRGEQSIGEAIVTEVRKDICGALVQKLESSTELVRVGDSAAVKTFDQ